MPFIWLPIYPAQVFIQQLQLRIGAGEKIGAETQLESAKPAGCDRAAAIVEAAAKGQASHSDATYQTGKTAFSFYQRKIYGDGDCSDKHHSVEAKLALYASSDFSTERSRCSHADRSADAVMVGQRIDEDPCAFQTEGTKLRLYLRRQAAFQSYASRDEKTGQYLEIDDGHQESFF